MSKRYILALLLAFQVMLQAEPLKTLVLTDRPAPFPLKECGVYIQGVDFSCDEDDLVDKLHCYLGFSIDQGLIDEIKEDIENYYQSIGRTAFLEVPSQEITDGKLQIVVILSRVGDVQILGNKWSRPCLLRSYLAAQEGDYFNEDSIAYDLDFMNRNRFRDVTAIYQPDKRERVTDVTLYSDERKPWLLYAGVQNNGVVTTGRTRWFIGTTINRILSFDHIFSYQFTTASDFNKFMAHTFQYIAYLPWMHELNMFGGYSYVDPDVGFPFTRTDGTSIQFSMRYKVPLPMSPILTQEMYGGWDWKRTNNTFEFVEDQPTIGNDVNLFQLLLGYRGTYRPGNNILEYEIEAVGSPGKWLPDQENSDYASLRLGAKNTWFYTRGLFSYLQVIPGGCTFFSRVRGQVSTQNLLPSEQLGIGGYDTVRGYDPRELNFDSGIIINAEFRLPIFSIIDMKFTREADDRFQLLGFFDWGWGRNWQSVPGQRIADYLMGIGPGIRYTIRDNVNFQLDWGTRLRDPSRFGGPGGRLHFTLIVSY